MIVSYQESLPCLVLFLGAGRTVEFVVFPMLLICSFILHRHPGFLTGVKCCGGLWLDKLNNWYLYSLKMEEINPSFSLSYGFFSPLVKWTWILVTWTWCFESKLLYVRSTDPSPLFGLKFRSGYFWGYLRISLPDVSRRNWRQERLESSLSDHSVTTYPPDWKSFITEHSTVSWLLKLSALPPGVETLRDDDFQQESFLILRMLGEELTKSHGKR